MSFLFVSIVGFGATTQPVAYVAPTYDCTRATEPVAIDGAIDEPAWKAAPWTTDFVDIVGAKAQPVPALQTRAKLLWDENHLYIAAEMTEPRVAATIRRRDEQLFREQVFELFIDPGADGRDYLELQINPLNTVCDLAINKPYIDGGKANVAFDLADLRSAVRVNGTVNVPSDIDESWTVEVAIPWAAIKALSTDTAAPPRAGQRWRMNFARMRPFDAGREEQAKIRRDMWVWSPQGAINMHLPHRWGLVKVSTADSTRS